MKPDLQLDFCSHQAAAFACRHWHYSRKIPVGKLVKVGVWENGKFIGAIIFGDGLLGPKCIVYGGIDKFRIAEIVRIALRDHQHEVSRMISIAIKLLRKRCPGIELIVAFADQGENHHGGIYQASNFIYTGESEPGRIFRHRATGRILHNRAVSVNGRRSHFGKVRKVPRHECEIIGGSRKRRYLLPLTPELKILIEKMRKPYPKRATSDTSDTPGVHPGEGRAARTVALQRFQSDHRKSKTGVVQLNAKRQRCFKTL
jgi:hypothetical protein